MDKTKTIYEIPYNVYKHYFPKGNKEEFHRAFVTFDVSKKEFKELIGDYKGGRYVCWNTVIFDLKEIKTPLRKCFGTIDNYNIPNSFRKEK